MKTVNIIETVLLLLFYIGFFGAIVTYLPKLFRGITGRWNSAKTKALESKKIKPLQPYIIKVQNNGPEALVNKMIFGGSKHLNDHFKWLENNYVDGDLIISSNIPDTTYRDIVSQITLNPVTIGLTYLSSYQPEQITQALFAIHFDANGNYSQDPILPRIDPYQQQSGVVGIHHVYRLSGNDILTVSKIQPNATILLYIYPAEINAKTPQII